jgi:membrane-associated phospholipid phosphatase
MRTTLMDCARGGNQGLVRQACLAELAGFFTDFADQAVVLPVCLCVVTGLALSGWRRGAAAFALASGAVLACMMLLKLLALGCGVFRPWADITSPSGHTAAAAALYGGGLALSLRRRLGPLAAACLASLPVAAAIGLTRLALHVHTGAEVVLGGAVGLAGVVGLVFLAGPPPRLRHPWRVVLAGLAVMLVLHGTRLPAEAQLRWASFHIWPFTLCRPGPKLAFAAGAQRA